MAIDDNTIYGLYGSQVKDLAQKVKDAGEGLTTLSYGSSTWNDFITAYNAGEIVYCRASSGSDPSVGSQTRMAFMAYVNDAANPTEVEFQYVRSVSTKSASNQSDQVFVYKLTNAGTWTVVTRPVMVKIAVGSNMTSSYSNNTLTLDATGGGSVTPVQTTGTSTTDVMSQNATTSMVFADPAKKQKISIRETGVDSSTGVYAIGIGSGALARGDASVSIGLTAVNYAAGVNSVTIGNAAKTEGHSRAVAVGNAANAAFDNSVALGSNAKTTRAGEVNVGADTSGRGYNNTNYRVIGGVHDPQSDHDAATKGYVDNSLLGKQDTLTAGSGISIADESGSLVISATGGSGGGAIELTSADYNWPIANPDGVALWLLGPGMYYTEGAQVYMSSNQIGDITNRGTFIVGDDYGTGTLAKLILYYDQNAPGAYLISTIISSGNRSSKNSLLSPTVVQTTGSSTANVMSQDATTKMIYNGGNSTKVQIGANSGAPQNWSVAILGATSQENTIAIGNAASATAKGAIALGVGSKASAQGVFDVGLSNTTPSIQSTNGYNGSEYRLLSGLYDPQNAHDAATKGYVDTAVAGAGASAFTTNEWNALWA